MATSHGFRQFSRRIKFLANMVEKSASREIRRAALVADQEAVLRTPVDTGNARSNWYVSVGKPVFRVEETASSPDDKGFNRQAASIKSLIQGSRVIGTWLIGQGAIYITNSVHYIMDLDRGSSRQAPHGMSRFAVEAARAVLKRARLLRG